MSLSPFSILKVGILTLASLCVFELHAQEDDSSFSPRFGIALQATNLELGGALELYLKPNVSVWTTIGYEQQDTRLGFGEKPGGILIVPEETIVYTNVQQRISFRAGVRFYEILKNKKWSGWYSPVAGYSNLSSPDSEYIQGYEREDLHFNYADRSRREAQRSLELGGEFGARRWFWRKPQTPDGDPSRIGLYAEGSLLVLGKKHLLSEKVERERMGVALHAALGIIF